MPARIAHLTSVHDRSDVRIFNKQCASLAAAGYQVHLVTADGKGAETRSGVQIVDVGRRHGRTRRIVCTPRKVLHEAIRINADLYHLHDPELLPIGLQLKRRGKLVVFDAHEDFPKQLLNKPYLTKFAAAVLSATATRYERHACEKFDAVVAATPWIRDKFLAINPRSIEVKNYPLLDELVCMEEPRDLVGSSVCYVGGLSTTRGICEIVTAMQRVSPPVRLILCGNFAEPQLPNQLEALHGWSRTDFRGYVDRGGIRKALSESFAGLVTLHPTPSYVESLPVKLFEYMAAGIPAIASDFPYWRSIIESEQCGLCVDPLQPDAIAGAINFLFDHPEEARRMGRNGRQAIVKRYNWDTEAASLLELYEDVLGSSASHARQTSSGSRSQAHV